MRKTLPEVVEVGRDREGLYASSFDREGINGRYTFKNKDGLYFLVVASDGFGWEHVSVSLPSRMRSPTWEEMCWIKSLFWEDNETVIQYHPSEENYVNGHPFCLHLWRPIYVDLPTPDPEMVGTKRMLKRVGMRKAIQT